VLLRLSDLWRHRLDREATSCPPLSLSLKVTPRLISPGRERSIAKLAAPFGSLAPFKRSLRHAVGFSIQCGRRVEIQQSVKKTPGESALNPLF